MPTTDELQRELHDLQLSFQRHIVAIETKLDAQTKKLDKIESITLKNQMNVERAVAGFIGVGSVVFLIAAAWNLGIEAITSALKKEGG